jgi:hypothetical protein
MGSSLGMSVGSLRRQQIDEHHLREANQSQATTISCSDFPKLLGYPDRN